MIGKTRRPPRTAVRGVLHRLDAGPFELDRAAPPAELADRIEHFWRVRWNLEGRPAQTQETLPHPNVHLVVEPGTAAAWGVHAGRWTRELAGRSCAFGVKFRPGGFRALLGRPVSSIADRSVDARELFGADAGGLEALTVDEDMDAAAERAAAFLRPRLPPADAQALLAGRIVDAAAEDRELRTVAALAARHALGVRALQRLFDEYVGASPKWVINRYRMHEAIAQVQAGAVVSWAVLANELGYFDQAHFIADFRRLVGRTPADYGRDHAPG